MEFRGHVLFHINKDSAAVCWSSGPCACSKRKQCIWLPGKCEKMKLTQNILAMSLGYRSNCLQRWRIFINEYFAVIWKNITESKCDDLSWDYNFEYICRKWRKKWSFVTWQGTQPHFLHLFSSEGHKNKSELLKT